MTLHNSNSNDKNIEQALIKFDKSHLLDCRHLNLIIHGHSNLLTKYFKNKKSAICSYKNKFKIIN